MRSTSNKSSGGNVSSSFTSSLTSIVDSENSFAMQICSETSPFDIMDSAKENWQLI
jgi:hypothetical protein